jgi:hypothetical protein
MSLLLLPEMLPSDGSEQTRRFMILVATYVPLEAYRRQPGDYQAMSWPAMTWLSAACLRAKAPPSFLRGAFKLESRSTKNSGPILLKNDQPFSSMISTM